MDKAFSPVLSKNTDNTDLLKKLEGIGLTSKEALVYVSLQGLDSVGSSHLIRATGLHGQFVYQALDHLVEKGLAQYVIRNGRKKWSAQPARRLLGLLHGKRRLAEGAIDELARLRVSEQPQTFELFQGDQAYRELSLQMLLDAEEGETHNLIGGAWKKFFETVGKKGFEEFERLRVSRKIHDRFIGPEVERALYQKSKTERVDFDYRVLPGMNTGLLTTSIWKKSIVLTFFGNPVMAFVLRNKEVAASNLDFFETLWKLGKE